MFDLCITQTEVWRPYDGPYLRVKPLFNGQIEFRYKPVSEDLWARGLYLPSGLGLTHAQVEEVAAKLLECRR